MSKEFAYWFQNIVMWCENCCQFHCFPLPHHHRGVCYVTCTWEVDWNCVMSLMRIFVNLSCMKNGAWPLYNHQKKSIAWNWTFDSPTNLAIVFIRAVDTTWTSYLRCEQSRLSNSKRYSVTLYMSEVVVCLYFLLHNVYKHIIFEVRFL